MMIDYKEINIIEIALSFALFIPLFIILITVLINSFLGPYLKRSSGVIPTNPPKVSVLIPARNEEANIRTVLESILRQDYPSYEVILLDDNSEDNTYEIASQYLYDSKLKIIKGEELPEKWLGKNWACKQLSQQAKGDIFIFTDADNFHESTAISKTVNMLKKHNLSLLSAFPQQTTLTFWEKLIIPMIDMIIYSGLILWTTKYISSPAFAAANGQWIAMKTEDYLELNGHEAVKYEVVEDVAMARYFKSKGKKILTIAGTGAVYGRMYSSFSDIWNGLSKNLFGLTNFKTFPFIIILIMMNSITFLPFAFLLSNNLFFIGIILITMNLIWKIILSIYFKHSILSVILYPFSTLIISMIGINSLLKSKTGRINWKGRSIKV